MANADTPNGYRAVKTVSGGPVSGLIRSVGCANTADIFVGDAFTITSGLAVPMAVEGIVAGVAIGFGLFDTDGRTPLGPYDPDNLGTPNYYDTSATTHTDWVCYYIPVEDVIFEVQNTTADTALVGEAFDTTVTTGSLTTGISTMEMDSSGAATNDGDIRVVEIPTIIGNDPTTVNGRYWVQFVNTLFNNAV